MDDNAPIDSRSQLTRDRQNGRPFLKVGISMSDVNKFKELDTSKYTVKPKPKVIRRSIFDAGLNAIR